MDESKKKNLEKKLGMKLPFFCVIMLVSLVSVLIFVFSNLNLKFQYVTYTLEATQVQSWKESMRSEGWKLVKKERVGERVYEPNVKDQGMYTDPFGRTHREIIDLYAVTFRRLVR